MKTMPPPMPPDSPILRRTVLHGLWSIALGAALPLKHARAQMARLSPEALAQVSSERRLARAEIEEMLKPLFECSDREIWRLTVDVYEQCILSKLRLPEPPLNWPWLTPGGEYVGQWLWDTMFVADLMSVLPGQDRIVQGVFQNYWDFQERWNATHPEYARGMIACVILPERIANRNPGEFPAYSQAPVLAWGMERVFMRTRDLDLIRQGIGHLEAFHEWYWRERDVTDVGLIAVGAYSGVPEHARFETYDFEADLDDLTLTRHPTRTGPGEGPWYGDICIPANTSYLLLSEASLARLAAHAGDTAMAARRRSRMEKGIAAMRRHMWDWDKGCFLAVRRDTLKKIPVATIGGFMALMAGVPTASQADRMAEVLAGAWATRLPVPTADPEDARFASDSIWRGDAWPATDYQIAAGLAAFGHRRLAAQIVDAMIDNALKVGISERYDSRSGAALGVRGLGMSCTLVTMALDGLSAKHAIRVPSH